MRTVYLYGWLAEKYGDSLKFDVYSISELMKAMKANFKDWEASIRDDEFEVVVGKDLDSNHLSEQELFLKFNNDNDFHLAPVTEGRKRGGVVKIIMGVTLIAIGLYLGQLDLIAAGAAMVAGGAIQLLTPIPELYEEKDNSRSFLFKGGVNTVEQGGPVPLVYGQCMCGSTVISASIKNEDILCPL